MNKKTNKKTVNIYIDKDFYSNVKNLTDNLGVSFNGYLNLCLHKHFKLDNEFYSDVDIKNKYK